MVPRRPPRSERSSRPSFSSLSWDAGKRRRRPRRTSDVEPKQLEGREARSGERPTGLGLQEMAKEEESADEQAKTRHFRIKEVPGVAFSEEARFSGTPAAAARKAAGRLFRGGLRVNRLDITMQETTRGSDKKSFPYEAIRQVLDPPHLLRRGDAVIECHQKISIVSRRGGSRSPRRRTG